MAVAKKDDLFAPKDDETPEVNPPSAGPEEKSGVAKFVDHPPGDNFDPEFFKTGA